MKNTSANHHIGAKITTDYMLSMWKSGNWLNNFISSRVLPRKSSANFPSVDREFDDDNTKAVIACEFKPSTETKRGILTGLGQAVAYLNDADISYLIVPSYIDSFNMEEFLKVIFKKFIYEKLPIGLIVFDNDYKDIRLAADISKSLKCHRTNLPKTESLPWAIWRDNPPVGIFRLVETGCNEELSTKDLRWEYFFDYHYAPKKTRENFEIISNDLYLFDPSKLQYPFEDHKTRIKKYKNEKLNKSEILREKTYSIDKDKSYYLRGIKETLSDKDYMLLLKRHCWDKEILENIFQTYEKNYKNFIEHLNLVDDFLKATKLGKMFVERCLFIIKNAKDKNDEASKINDELAQILLVVGKFHDLILDIDEYQSDIEDNEEFLKKIISDFDKKGIIPRNANRRTSGKRKFLQSEKQMMNSLLLIDDKGDKIYNFNHVRIDSLIKEFYDNYGAVYKE